MSDFQYSKATSADDASAQVKSTDEGALIAGGMTLLPSIKLGLAAPTDIIDLSGAQLNGISIDSSAVDVGAMTRHSDVASSKEVNGAISALALLAGGIGDRQVRNRGTIGGSLANNDPAADYPAACLGLGAVIKTNERTIGADEFFTGFFQTALGDGEVITSVSFPIPEKAAYVKMDNPASRYALVGVFVSDGPQGIRVAVTGAGSNGVYREANFEKALTSNFDETALSGMKADENAMLSDLHAAADYRAHLVGEIARRAVESCKS
ncbi:MAG: xanthine dehydrogenase family protein subunit M [Pseudomonadota bacterium]|nr:xanthine dehydrogenase family protein subunit M [Pseudomonadota bacterium]